MVRKILGGTTFVVSRLTEGRRPVCRSVSAEWLSWIIKSGKSKMSVGVHFGVIETIIGRTNRSPRGSLQ